MENEIRQDIIVGSRRFSNYFWSFFLFFWDHVQISLDIYYDDLNNLVGDPTFMHAVTVNACMKVNNFIFLRLILKRSLSHRHYYPPSHLPFYIWVFWGELALGFYILVLF